jgi:hypothetical protein
MTFFCAGVGLLFAGCVNGLLRTRVAWVRVAATAGIAFTAVTAVAAVTDEYSAAAECGLLLSIGLVACVAAGSERVASTFTWIASWVRVPAVRWSAVAVLGTGTAVGSVIYYEEKEASLVDDQMAELEILTAKPAVFSPTAQAYTDLGNSLPIQEASAPRDEGTLRVLEEAIAKVPSVKESAIRRQPATDRSNCHGWVFTDGRYWLTGSDVDKILAENGYVAVTVPKPGDLAIFRNGEEVVHSAVVRYVTEGYPTLVESKWGSAGVFLHPPEKSIYGSNFTYYRSPRTGHLLAGLGTSPNSNASMHSQMSPIMPDPDNPDEFTE